MKKTICILISFALLFLSCGKDKNASIKKSITDQTSNRILFIVSNAHFYGNSEKNTANHFSEIIQAYDVFYKAGFIIDFVSPEGGAIPIGYIKTSDSLQKKYLYDNDFMDVLENTLKPKNVNPTNYLAVYYGGGGAAMFGIPENKEIQGIVMQIYEKNKGIISTVCHGTAGIVNLKTKDGNYLVSGKKVNGFPDVFENMEADYYKTFPFSIQQIITKRGGDFQYTTKKRAAFTVTDGRLITGQDPSAASLVARKVITTISAKNKLNN